MIRKKLVKAWNIQRTGPTIDFNNSEGTFNKPLDITDLKIALADFKLLNMILSDTDYKSVKNLTAEKVHHLDKWANEIYLDTYRWLYIGRTRHGDDTGN